MTAAVVVMGSATPDVETCYLARQGRYRLLELPHRIPFENRPDQRQANPAAGSGNGAANDDSGDTLPGQWPRLKSQICARNCARATGASSAGRWPRG